MEKSQRRSSVGIREENEDEEAGMDSTVTEIMNEEEEFLHFHPEERIYKEILEEARNFQSYREPHQLSFELANEVRPIIRPLI
jgi:hypothetical protein